MEGKFVILFAR